MVGTKMLSYPGLYQCEDRVYRSVGSVLPDTLARVHIEDDQPGNGG